MGYSFSNIQVKTAAEPERIAEILTEGRGLKEAADPGDADIVIAVGGEGAGPWVTVVSDLFDADAEQTVACAKKLAGELQAETLAIAGFDSDYVFLNLLDPKNGTDAWAACGRFPDGKAPRRSSYPAWKGVVPDPEAFRQVMRKTYAAAEDCLEDLEGMLELPVSRSGSNIEMATEERGYRCFRFVIEDSGEKQAPAVFKPSYTCYEEYFLEWNNLVTFVNTGGRSRGVGVCITGPCVTEKQAEILNPYIQTHDARGKWLCLPLQLKETEFANGVKGWYGTLPELRIPEAVPDGLPLRKAMDLYFRRGISVRFRLRRIGSGSEPLGTLHVILLPLQNVPGQSVRSLRPMTERPEAKKDSAAKTAKK